MYTKINPTPESPLVLLMDEIDILITSIHNNTITLNKRFPIAVYNKITWNKMLDKIDYGLYPNLLLIMCSNKPYKEIQELDATYLRQGRVDLVEHLG